MSHEEVLRDPEAGPRGEDICWEWPVPIPTEPPPPPFPVDLLPEWMRDWVLGIAEEKGASPDIGANLAVAVVAGALARHVQVSPRPGWYEPTNVYVISALVPGQRKTPVFKEALRPVRTLENKAQGRVEKERPGGNACPQTARQARARASPRGRAGSRPRKTRSPAWRETARGRTGTSAAQ